MSTPLVIPEPTVGEQLSDAQVLQWQTQGYVLVDGLLSPEICESMRNEIKRLTSNMKSSMVC